MVHIADDIFVAGNSAELKNRESWTATSSWVWYRHHLPEMYSGSLPNTMIENPANDPKKFPALKLKCATTSSRVVKETTNWYKPSLQPPPFVKLTTAGSDENEKTESSPAQEKTLDEMQDLKADEDVTEQEYETAVLEQVFGDLPAETFLDEESQEDVHNTAGWVETPCEISHTGDFDEEVPPQAAYQLDTYQPMTLGEDNVELTDEVILTGDWGVTVKAREVITERNLMVTFFHAVAGENVEDIDVDVIVREAQIQAYVHDHTGCTPSMLGLMLHHRDDGLVQYGLVQEFKNSAVKEVPLSQVSSFSKEQLCDSTWLKLVARLVKITQVLTEIGVPPSGNFWDGVFLQRENGELVPLVVNCSIYQHSHQSPGDCLPFKDEPVTSIFAENKPTYCLKAEEHHLLLYSDVDL